MNIIRGRRNLNLGEFSMSQQGAVGGLMLDWGQEYLREVQEKPGSDPS